MLLQPRTCPSSIVLSISRHVTAAETCPAFRGQFVCHLEVEVLLQMRHCGLDGEDLEIETG